MIIIIINKIDFPIYDIIIVLSLFLGMIYIYICVDKEGIPKKNIIFFFTMFFIIIILCGKIYTLIEYPDSNFWKIGVTGYGGLLGGILSAIIYYCIYKDNRFIKYTIISLPLMYGFAKLACFINGCCYGIPYNGIFAVTYPHIMSKSLFPIQLVETIAFVVLFMVCNTLNKHKNIIYITLLLVFVIKFLLDFLRYSHTYEFLSNNQIVSIVFCFITIIIYFINKRKKVSQN